MRGHLPLVAMRANQRRIPPRVCLVVGKGPNWLADHWHEGPDFWPEILVEPGDSIQRLDLRFVHRLLVDVSGDVADSERIQALFEACVQAGADRVLGCIHRTKATGEIESIEYLDTAGVLTWQN